MSVVYQGDSDASPGRFAIVVSRFKVTLPWYQRVLKDPQCSKHYA